MQALSGSIGASLITSKAQLESVETQATSEMAGTFSFLANLMTQIDSAVATPKAQEAGMVLLTDAQPTLGKLLPHVPTSEATLPSMPFASQSLQNLVPKEVAALEMAIEPELEAVLDLEMEAIVDEFTSMGDLPELTDSKLFTEILTKPGEGADPNLMKFQLLQNVQNGFTRLSATANGLTATAQMVVANQFGGSGWGEEMASRVQWQIGKDIQEAKINLNPRELGPIEVKVNVTDDQAQVQFVSHHGAVREAVEEAIPRLRELLAESGITLTDANVADQQSSNNPRNEETREARAIIDDDQEIVDSTEVTSVAQKGMGLVDAYI